MWIWIRPAFGGFGDDAVAERAVEEFGEDGEDVKSAWRLLLQFRSTRPSGRLTSIAISFYVDAGADRFGEGDQQIFAVRGSHLDQRRASGLLQSSTTPSDRPVRVEHLAAYQVGLIVLRPPGAAARCSIGIETSAPASRSASEMVSTPLNLKIS